VLREQSVMGPGAVSSGETRLIRNAQPSSGWPPALLQGPRPWAESARGRLPLSGYENPAGCRQRIAGTRIGPAYASCQQTKTKLNRAMRSKLNFLLIFSFGAGHGECSPWEKHSPNHRFSSLPGVSTTSWPWAAHGCSLCWRDRPPRPPGCSPALDRRRMVNGRWSWSSPRRTNREAQRGEDHRCWSDIQRYRGHRGLPS